MNSPKLSELKKELGFKDPLALQNLCLRLTKYKTENKELLHYLLFYEDRKEDYVSEVKNLMAAEFNDLHHSIYYVTKQLRKLTRIMNKHIKYISDKNVETELALYFSELFIDHSIVNSSHRALIGLLYRQLKRSDKLIGKLEEDLAFDYQQQLDTLLFKLKKNRPSFQSYEIG
jgi:hypothetical protein